MPNPRLASRYAKALIDLAIETNQLDVVFKDMQMLQSVSNVSREFVNFIKSPVINADKKAQIFDAVFMGGLSNLTEQFCKLLIRKGREKYIPEIVLSGIDQYRIINHIQQATITTAIPMDETLRNDIIAKIKSEIPDKQIELISRVNNALVGGFVLESNNQLFDASILRDLKDVKMQFMKNVYVRNIR